MESAVRAKYELHFQNVARVFRALIFSKLGFFTLIPSSGLSQILYQIQVLGLDSISHEASHVSRASISCRMPPCSLHGNSCKAVL